jgi:hypothetical protein
LLGYLFDKQKYNKKLTIMQLPELPKMYRRKYKNSTEIQEAGCRKRKLKCCIFSQKNWLSGLPDSQFYICTPVMPVRADHI